MATTKHKAYSGAIATAHSTSLNSLANNANSAASSAIDNSTALLQKCASTPGQTLRVRQARKPRNKPSNRNSTVAQPNSARYKKGNDLIEF